MTDIDTGTEDLLARESDGVVVITLNRPQARNAMSGPMNAGARERTGLCGNRRFGARGRDHRRGRCVLCWRRCQRHGRRRRCWGGRRRGADARRAHSCPAPKSAQHGWSHVPDAQTRRRRAAGCGRWGRSGACAGCRSANHGRQRLHHHGVCEGWVQRRLRWIVFSCPNWSDWARRRNCTICRIG